MNRAATQPAREEDLGAALIELTPDQVQQLDQEAHS
jgi:hypothetical protein